MKKLFYLFPLFLFCNPEQSDAQNPKTVNFQYDAAGRRISRSNTDIYMIHTLDDVSGSDTIYAYAIQREQEIRIAPNPTNGVFSVSLQRLEKDSNNEIQIFSLTGKLLFQEEMKETFMEINISNYESGTYILIVRNGKNVNDFKLIKK